MATKMILRTIKTKLSVIDEEPEMIDGIHDEPVETLPITLKLQSANDFASFMDNL